MKSFLSTPAARILLAIFAAAAVCPAFAEDMPTPPDVSFYTKLRMEYARRPDFDPAWKSNEQRQAIITAYKAGDYEKVAGLSKAWLAKCPVDADMHVIRSHALVALGDITHYAAERYFFYGLLQSIASSGDGQDEKTAFRVISNEEEFFLLADFGAQPTGQSMQGTCDVIRCKLADGKEVTYYFDISIPLAAEAKEQKPKK